MPYASNNNAVLISGCSNLQNLSVLLEVTEDLATTDGSGWSFQLQCYPPPGQYCQTSQVNIFQYIVYVQAGISRMKSSTGRAGCPLGLLTISHSRTRHRGCPAGPTTTTSRARLRALAATRCRTSRSFRFSLEPIARAWITLHSATPTRMATCIAACVQAACSASNRSLRIEPGRTGGGSNANFTLGLTNSRGIIYYSVSSGQLSVQSGGPGSACGEAGLGHRRDLEHDLLGY